MWFRESYGMTKGSPERRLEDGLLGNLAPPGDLEESASHHFHGPGPKVPASQRFRLSTNNGVDTIGKSAKNHDNPPT